GHGYLHDFGDIFELERHGEEIRQMEGFGDKSYQNLINSTEAARRTTLPRLLYGLGIPNVGASNAKLICRHFDYDLDRIRHATADELAKIDGIGPVIGKSMQEYFEDPKNNCRLDHLLEHLEIEKPETGGVQQSMEGITFVITGSLERFENRSAAKSFIEERGGKVTGSVTSKTNYLINNDIHS